MLKRILFPFFKSRHEFLLSQWWFRLLITVYVAMLLISIPYSWYRIVASQYEDCETNSIAVYGSRDEALLNGAFVRCAEMEWAFGWNIPSFLYIFIPVIVLHYFFQLLFFKVLLDFIVLHDK